MIDNLVNYFFIFAFIAAIYVWLYCLWFAVKFDRSSYSILLLIVFNILYVPFYFSRIERIKNENTENLEGEDFEFLKFTRDSIVEILELWASKTKQINYQKSENEINVTEELFQQWKDLYLTDNEFLLKAFVKKEIDLLNEFNKTLVENMTKVESNFPTLEEYQKSSDWEALNSLSIRILNELKR